MNDPIVAPNQGEEFLLKKMVGFDAVDPLNKLQLRLYKTDLGTTAAALETKTIDDIYVAPGTSHELKTGLGGPMDTDNYAPVVLGQGVGESAWSYFANAGNPLLSRDHTFHIKNNTAAAINVHGLFLTEYRTAGQNPTKLLFIQILKYADGTAGPIVMNAGATVDIVCNVSISWETISSRFTLAAKKE